MVAGAPGDDELGSTSGAAYVFVRSGDTWNQQAKLLAADGQSSDKFGASVAIDRDTVVVGSAFDDDFGSSSGSAYVFVRSGDAWTQQAKLLASDGFISDVFGTSVAISGDTVVVGAPGHDVSRPGMRRRDSAGAAYVFVRSGDSWSQQAELTVRDPLREFGTSVAIDGDVVVVGDDQDGEKGGFAGAAHVYVRKNGTWRQHDKLTPDPESDNDRFGTSVAISDGTVMAGTPREDGVGSDEGAVYVFEFSNTAPVAASEAYTVDEGATLRVGIPVTNVFSSDPGSLQRTIADARSGDTIYFDFDIFDFIAPLGPLVIDKDLTIVGPGVNSLFIAVGPTFIISADAKVKIFGMEMVGRSVSSPGGVIRNFGTLTLTNVLVNGGTAGHSGLHLKGGGIYNTGTLNLVNSTVRGNTAFAGGGGIFNDGGTVNITNSTFRENFGGAILNEAGGTVNVTSSTISGSTTSAGAAGGGIRNVSGTVNMKNVTISGNVSGNVSASGIDNRSGGTVNVNNSTITGNGIAGRFTPLVATGGGIANVGTVNMSNTIVAGNSATTGSDISGTVNSQGFNLVGDTAGSSGLGAAGDLQNVSAQLGPLQYNGGPTKTHGLLSTSLAIDAGSVSFLGLPCEAKDQRGAARPVDGPDADTDPVCDIGAFEFGGAGPFTPDEADAPKVGVLFNDTDTDRDPLMAVLVSDVSNGTDLGGVTYVHSGDENTADSFTYRATDGAAESGVVTVNITVRPVNDGPTAVDDGGTVDEGGTVSVLDSGQSSLLANDSDPEGDNLAVNTTPVSGPGHGAVILSGDGTFSYTHDASETTGDNFVYQVCDDGTPSQCTDGTVNITVNPINEAPTAVDDSTSVNEGGTVTTLTVPGGNTVLGNDTDPEGQTLTVDTTPVSGPFHGSLVLSGDGRFIYTHDAGEDTGDSFTYRACDPGTPPLCDTATAPRGGTVRVLDSGEASLLANDVDPDGPDLRMVTSPARNPIHGQVRLTGDGTFHYTHDGGSSTGDNFGYTICDFGSPNFCSSATVTITVIEACIFPTPIVKTGWNLIGWSCDDPGNPGDIATSLGVSSTNGLVRLLAWDADSQSFTQSFRSDRPFNNLAQLTKFVGYWLFFQAPTGTSLPQEAIPITGTAGAAPVCTFPTTIVKAGWNVIGWACLDPGVPQDIAGQLGVTSTAGLVRFLEWDADSQSFTRSFRSDRPFNNLTQLTQWAGYWLFYQPP